MTRPVWEDDKGLDLSAENLVLAENEIYAAIEARVSKDTIVVNAADHGLALNGVTDDGPALNALITSLAAQVGTGTEAIITIPPGKSLGLGTPVVRQSRVSIDARYARVTVLAALKAGPVFTNSNTGKPLIRSDLFIAEVEKAGLTGILFDCHSPQWCRIDVGIMLGGTELCTNLKMQADTAEGNSEGSKNAVANVTRWFDRGSCASAGVLRGSSENAVVTLNVFRDCHTRGIFGVGWDCVEWCDDNFWTGVCSNRVLSSAAVVVRQNGSATPAESVGVYCNHFAFLTAENYGVFTPKGIVLNYSRGTVVRQYFADPGFEEGRAVENLHSQSHYIERVGKHSTNNMYVYREGYYEAFNDEASNADSGVKVLKARADGNVNALDFLGSFSWWATTNGTEREQARWRSQITDITANKEKSEVWLYTRTQGALEARYRFADDGRIGIGTATFSGLGAGLYVTPPANSIPVIRGAGASGQTADLLQLFDNTLTSKLFAVNAKAIIELSEQSLAPATPEAGKALLFVKGEHLWFKNHLGEELKVI